jgi:hypothetical protein
LGIPWLFVGIARRFGIARLVGMPLPFGITRLLVRIPRPFRITRLLVGIPRRLGIPGLFGVERRCGVTGRHVRREAVDLPAVPWRLPRAAACAKPEPQP